MIFHTEKNTLQEDLTAFLSVPVQRQAVFDNAPDSLPVFGLGVNAQQERLHPATSVYTVRDLIYTENGILTITLQTQNGTVPPYRAGQQARVFCPDISYSLFLAGAYNTQPEGFLQIAVSPICQPDAFAYLAGRQEGDSLRLTIPVGQFYFLPPRDQGAIVFLADSAGLPAARAFAEAVGSEQDIAFFCVNCHPEPFFDKRFHCIPSVENIKQQKTHSHCFIAGSRIFCERAFAICNYSARVCCVEAPTRLHGTKKTFSCMCVGAIENRTISCDSDIPLLSSLEKAGIEIPARCNNGECGFCRCRLTSGSITVFTSPWQQDSRRCADAERNVFHACCSFPDSDLTIIL